MKWIFICLEYSEQTFVMDAKVAITILVPKKNLFSLANFSTLLFINLNSKLKRRKVVDDNLIFHFFLCCKCAWVLDEKFVQIIVIDWIQFAFRHFFPWTWEWFKPCVGRTFLWIRIERGKKTFLRNSPHFSFRTFCKFRKGIFVGNHFVSSYFQGV